MLVMFINDFFFKIGAACVNVDQFISYRLLFAL